MKSRVFTPSNTPTPPAFISTHLAPSCPGWVCTCDLLPQLPRGPGTQACPCTPSPALVFVTSSPLANRRGPSPQRCAASLEAEAGAGQCPHMTQGGLRPLTLGRGGRSLGHGLGVEEIQCSLILLGLTLRVRSVHLLGAPTLPSSHLPALLVQLLLPGLGGRRLFDCGHPCLLFLSTRILADQEGNSGWVPCTPVQSRMGRSAPQDSRPHPGRPWPGLTMGASAGTAALLSGTLVGVVALLLFSRCCRRRAASCSSCKESNKGPDGPGTTHANSSIQTQTGTLRHQGRMADLTGHSLPRRGMQARATD